ncbi:SH3 and multiple ankyrin repeat domains protein 2 [Gaertneriomyces sp. JEL0708]|nr:SH3 and multiple ankyrin repeat domains protein 2 [Gaertneriomyces sp. JEL0708]
MSSPLQTAAAGGVLIVRISVPSENRLKALKVALKDTVWSLKQQVISKVASGIEDVLNYGLYSPPDVKSGKQGKFLDEKREIGTYLNDNNSLLEFVPKHRVVNVNGSGEAEPGSPALHNKKKQKKFAEDVQRGNIEKVKEKGARGLDPNFWTESLETPLSIAVMNNDRDMITSLVENGAILDYRLSKKDGWKTPLHMAAQSNKIGALQALIQFGAWVNAPDALNLTPLYYAVVGGHHDCTLRLLAARADTEVFDESGKGPMHQAVFQNNEVIASLLIDYGANLNVGNAVGNTPLHVAATRNAKECARWLIMRGCEREKTNKSGQTASQLASMSGNVDIADMIRKFTDDQIIPPPPRPSPEEINLGGFATGTITRQNTMRGHISDLDRGHLSFSSMDGSMPRSTSVSSITSSSLSGKRDSVVTLGGSRKRTTRMNSMRKSMAFPPPPSRQSSFPGSEGFTDSTDAQSVGSDVESRPASSEVVAKPSNLVDTPVEQNSQPAEGNSQVPKEESTQSAQLRPEEVKKTENTPSHLPVAGTSPSIMSPITIMGHIKPPSKAPPAHLLNRESNQSSGSATSESSSNVPAEASRQESDKPSMEYIVTVLQSAVESGKGTNLEVDWASILSSLTALESQLRDANQRAVRAEEEVQELKRQIVPAQ